MSSQTILRVIFKLAMITGLIYQVTQITSTYLAYKVTNSVRMSTPEEVSVPTTSVCFPIERLINQTSSTYLKYERQHLMTPGAQSEDYEQVSVRYTMSEIFADTPLADQLLSPDDDDTCFFRNKTTAALEFYN